MSTAPPERCDVAVIGGGPGGAVAAARLAAAGYQVVLLEKASHPRETVGESLIPHFWRFADAIGASDAIERAGFVAKSGGVSFWKGELRGHNFREFGYTRPPLHVDRDEFDAILLDCAARAGALVFQETPVIDVALRDDGVSLRYRQKDQVEREISARYLVDASGQGAVVSKQFGFRRFDDNFRFQAFWGYFDGGDYVTYRGDRIDVCPFADRFATPPATLLSGLGEWSWGWHIVLRERVSVGIILPSAQVQQLRRSADSLEAAFLARVRSLPLTSRLLVDAELDGPIRSIRDYAYRPVHLTYGRAFLVGDAAAFVDPINSAGVSFSMYSGFLAAFSIDQSLRSPSRAADYRELFEREYGTRLNLFVLLAYPGEIPEELAQQAEAAIARSSAAERRLMMTATTLTGRSGNVRRVLDAMGVEHEEFQRRLTVPASLRS